MSKVLAHPAYNLYDRDMQTFYPAGRAIPSKISDWIIRTLSIDKCTDILDVGTGPGSLALKLASKSDNVLGIDISLDFLAMAAREAAVRKLPARFALADANRLDELGCKFDVITAAQVMHWLDATSTMLAMLSVLRPGGSIVFVESKPIIGCEHPLRRTFGFGTLPRENLLSECERHRNQYQSLFDALLQCRASATMCCSAMFVGSEKKLFSEEFAMSYFMPHVIESAISGQHSRRSKVASMFNGVSKKDLYGEMGWLALRFQRARDVSL